MMREAQYWKRFSASSVRCLLCPCRCLIQNNQTGRCLARRNLDGVLYAESYGQVTSMALDPVEKKPLRLFEPGKTVLSVGGYGCNLACPFCQNHEISTQRVKKSRELSPKALANLAAEAVGKGNIGVAYTYNEPLIGYEYVLDCAKLIWDIGLKNVLVTNGMINSAPLKELLCFVDAMNIDLKCFTGEGYRRLGGMLEPVKTTIRSAAGVCHVEVTTLIVPGFNDSEDEIEALAEWLATVDEEIPLHVSRYTPRHMYKEPATDVELVYRLADIARAHLKNVYTGNC